MATAPVFIGAAGLLVLVPPWKPADLAELAALAAELTLEAIWDERLARADVTAEPAEPVAVESSALSDESRLPTSPVMLAISDDRAESTELTIDATAPVIEVRCDEREASSDDTLAGMVVATSVPTVMVAVVTVSAWE